MTTSANNGRRDFVKVAGFGALAAGIAKTGSVFAQGKDEVKVGVIGCGGRGSGAARDAITADPDRVKIVALGDLFGDRMSGIKSFLGQDDRKKNNGLTEDNCYFGLDAYKKVLKHDLDYVILATPPYFRPMHFAAAIEAGKNVFTEKPVAVDPVGVRMFMDAGKKATEKGLCVVAGLQRHYSKEYLEALERVKNGEIGKIVSMRGYWNQTQLWHKKREQGWSDMEWMIRDWVNWCWLSGDHIVEQHVHNIDVCNWFKGTHPVKAVGMGGHAHRPTGDQYDYFAVDYTYADDVHLASYCRQINQCDRNVSETIVGEKGTLFLDHPRVAKITGEKPWQFKLQRGQSNNAYVHEHEVLMDHLRNGKKINNAQYVAESTMTAIMGRIAAYTGAEVTWEDVMKSDLKLGPAEINMDVKLPEVKRPVPGVA